MLRIVLSLHGVIFIIEIFEHVSINCATISYVHVYNCLIMNKISVVYLVGFTLLANNVYLNNIRL